MLHEALCVLFAATRSRDAILACLFSTLYTQIVGRAQNEEHTQPCEVLRLSRRRFADNLAIVFALRMPSQSPLLECSVFAVPERQQRACRGPERFWL